MKRYYSPSYSLVWIKIESSNEFSENVILQTLRNLNLDWNYSLTEKIHCQEVSKWRGKIQSLPYQGSSWHNSSSNFYFFTDFKHGSWTSPSHDESIFLMFFPLHSTPISLKDANLLLRSSKRIIIPTEY